MTLSHLSIALLVRIYVFDDLCLTNVGSRPSYSVMTGRIIPRPRGLVLGKQSRPMPDPIV